MATDARAGGAVLGELLGDVPARSTTVGRLGAGTMLDAADRLARRLLMEVDGDDAAQLLRGWPSVARAAAALWRALPAHRFPATGEPEQHMNRLQVLADSIAARLGSGWPGRGPSDPRLTHISELLTAVAEVVERDAGGLSTCLSGGRGDRPDANDVARTRLMHVLYLTAHAIGVTLYQHGRECYPDLPDAEQDPAGATLHPPYLVEPLAGWVQRLALCESVAGSYVNRHRSTSRTTNTGTSPPDPGRLHRVLTSWDIQAHRALASDPTPTDILLVTRAQGLIAGAGLVLVDAAARANLLQSPVGTERLLGKIHCVGQAWATSPAGGPT